MCIDYKAYELLIIVMRIAKLSVRFLVAFVRCHRMTLRMVRIIWVNRNLQYD